MTKISFIFGTYNRSSLLQNCINTISYACHQAGVAYEVCVCDGGSADDTLTHLSCVGAKFVVEAERKGAVSAFNQAFTLVDPTTDFVMNLNDDVALQPTAIKLALDVFAVTPKAAQVAFEHNTYGRWEVQKLAGLPYGNYSLTRKAVVDKVVAIQGGYWNPIYHTYGADCEFSCWIWSLGYQVAPCSGRVVDHMAKDDLRKVNLQANKQHGCSQKFYQRWSPLEETLSKRQLPNVSEAELARYKECLCERIG